MLTPSRRRRQLRAGRQTETEREAEEKGAEHGILRRVEEVSAVLAGDVDLEKGIAAGGWKGGVLCL